MERASSGLRRSRRPVSKQPSNAPQCPRALQTADLRGRCRRDLPATHQEPASTADPTLEAPGRGIGVGHGPWPWTMRCDRSLCFIAKLFLLLSIPSSVDRRLFTLLVCLTINPRFVLGWYIRYLFGAILHPVLVSSRVFLRRLMCALRCAGVQSVFSVAWTYVETLFFVSRQRICSDSPS